VGFVRSLPHGLVAAFRATLEEVNDADLLLLVVDAAHPNAEDHIKAVFAVLDEIKAGPKPMVRVLNKADIADPADLRALMRSDLPAVSVSAHTGEGLDRLAELIDAHFGQREECMRFRVPQSDAGVITRLHDAGKVLSETYEDNDILLEAVLDPSRAAPFLPYREV
jgi:GTPase